MSVVARPPTSPCPSVDELIAFVSASATDELRRTIEAHVDACADCRSTLADAVLAQHGSVTTGGVAGPPLASLEGTTLGRFTLGAQLGAGAMGVVYAAHDRELEREVAVKLSRLPPDRDPAATARANLRAMAEARALARVQHRNVVAIHDVGMIDNVGFIVMERLVGVALDRWAHDRSIVARLAIVAQAGRGLAAAHARGLVHGDVKPANVVVVADRAVVVDFGVATASATSRPGTIRGTPAYMAPEAERGAALTPASDVYAFAVMTVECLTGQRPDARPRWTREVPGAVAATLRACLAADPGHRPTMPEVVAALERAARQPRRRRIALAAAAAAVVVASGAAAIAIAWRRPDAARVAQARCAARVERTARALWSPARATALRHGFARVETPYAATAADSVVARLDAWADAWRAQQGARCPAPVADATTACLDQLYRLAERRVAELVNADSAGVERAVASAFELPMPSVCASWPAGVLEARAWDPHDPVLDAAQTLRDDLRLGRVDDVARGLSRFRADTGWLQHPARAQLHVVLGRATAVLGRDPADAERHLATGARLADELRQDYLRAEANVELAHLRSEQVADPDGAMAALEQADAAVARSGRPPALTRKVDAARANLALLRGDDAEAADRLAAIVAAEASEPPSPTRARHLDMWGIALLDRDPARAAEACTAARDMFATLVGARHPDTAAAMLGIATARMRQGHHDDAIDVLRDAQARLRDVIADDRDPALMIRHNLALVLAEAGRADEAIVELTAIVAIETARTELPPCAREHRVAEAELALGAALANAGRSDAGLAPIERGLAAYQRCEVAPTQLAHAHYLHGSVLAQVRGASAGVGALERALALLADAPGLVRAAPEFMLAQLLDRIDPRRARRLAIAARGAYLEVGATPDADEITRWLAAR